MNSYIPSLYIPQSYTFPYSYNIRFPIYTFLEFYIPILHIHIPILLILHSILILPLVFNSLELRKQLKNLYNYNIKIMTTKSGKYLEW